MKRNETMIRREEVILREKIGFKYYLFLIPDSEIFSEIRKEVKNLEKKLKKYKAFLEKYPKIREELREKLEEVQKEYTDLCGDLVVVGERKEVVFEKDSDFLFIEGQIKLRGEWDKEEDDELMIIYQLSYKDGEIEWYIKEDIGDEERKIIEERSYQIEG